MPVMPHSDSPTARGHARSWMAAALTVAMVSQGCLTATYEVPHDEVERLLTVEASKRGEHIRAVQRFTTAKDITPAQPWGQPGQISGDGAPVGGGPGMAPLYSTWRPNYYGWGEPYYGPTLYMGPSGSSGGGLANGGPPSAGVNPGSKSGFASALGKADRDSARGAAAVVIVAAVALGVALAASEGARYDGTVAVHPHHPVHVLGNSGDRTIALDELRLGDVNPEDTVVLAGHEGSGMWLRGRAPLDRVGFTYGIGAGYQSLQLRKGAVANGSNFEASLGMFMTPWLGVVGRMQFVDGAMGGGDFIGLRSGAEVQAIPIALGRLHIGAYGGAAYEWAKASGGELPFTDDKHLVAQAGGLIEIDWTTRLGLYLRYGVTSVVAGGARGDWLTGLSLGLAVY